MASRAMVSSTAADRSGCGAVRDPRRNLPSVVPAAGLADVMGQLELAAVAALDQVHAPQPVMGTAHVALRLRYFRFRYCHGSRPRLARRRSRCAPVLELR